ncbi:MULTISPECIES: hypothetical protein [unclassified Herbaspirillum]|jgi:hypothetical protein|uniref:hypothetical protein n=1 Tax=unclassified Herbaspirillum TaxID=2624150 RepID=UPI000E2E6E00|nr:MULTISPECIES: hypothetical protein [unclassified Herbaspirillum]RFB70693.1 hypothetical protein DZB54_08605 [Herbaspirillum sp. 3R-3a1]TFI08787.1 hypothetical protein E4P32_11660 [Herbaspirillum sp. 3R11]TFI15202.1 hypothetical protein E4P31_11655 [Herbaspirillum sp. 3R-11]TFI22035.1 hypothetical protein E4P30_19700 [Herbaspirillum sp. 3C11]
MKRLFAILLICLLPVQVFAGMLTYKTAIDSVALEQQVQQQEQLRQALELAAASGADVNADDAVAQQQALADSTDGDDDLSYADTEDFSSHAGVGDETVLNPAMAFVSDSATLAPALRSDDARQPPFLPLAGRPPRV